MLFSHKAIRFGSDLLAHAEHTPPPSPHVSALNESTSAMFTPTTSASVGAPQSPQQPGTSAMHSPAVVQVA
jgi:hypothetical protein